MTGRADGATLHRIDSARPGGPLAASNRPTRRPRVRPRRVHDVGPAAAVLAPVGRRRTRRDPGPPHAVVAAGRGDHPGGAAPLVLDTPAAAAAQAHRAGPGLRVCDLAELVPLHLGGQRRARARSLARVLHQPAGQHRLRGTGAARTAAAASVDRGGRRRTGRRGDDRRLRPDAVDRTRAGPVVRDVRAGEEEHQARRHRGLQRRDRAPGAAGAGLPGLPRGPRGIRLRHRRNRAGPAARRVRHRHRGAADLLRRLRGAAAADHGRHAPVPGPHLPVPAGADGLRRADAAGALGRLRAGVGRAGTADLGRAADRPAGAHRAGDRRGAGGRGRRRRGGPGGAADAGGTPRPGPDARTAGPEAAPGTVTP
ncbi:hypothetical protein DC74_3867 [Streptomyces noursei]|nr:hypothetical protein DC74_3867 [Streptomyces noursei]